MNTNTNANINPTEEFKDEFVSGFISIMPDWWEGDYESPNPWGCPWQWAHDEDWYKAGVPASELGKAWAIKKLPEIEKIHAEELALAEDEEGDAE